MTSHLPRIGLRLERCHWCNYRVPGIQVILSIAKWGNVPGTLAGGGLAARFGGLNIFLTGTLALTVGMGPVKARHARRSSMTAEACGCAGAGPGSLVRPAVPAHTAPARPRSA
jgi:hypothetical protein